MDGVSGKLVALVVPLRERKRERLEKVMGGTLGRLCPLWRGERGRKRERKKERKEGLGMVWLVEHSGLRFWPELVCSTLLCLRFRFPFLLVLLCVRSGGSFSSPTRNSVNNATPSSLSLSPLLSCCFSSSSSSLSCASCAAFSGPGVAWIAQAPSQMRCVV